MKDKKKQCIIMFGILILLLLGVTAVGLICRDRAKWENALRCDIMVRSENGFSEESIDHFETIGQAEGQYIEQKTLILKDRREEVLIASVNENVEIPVVSEGRLPNKPGEAVATATFAEEHDLTLYDQLIMKQAAGNVSFKVVGFLLEGSPAGSDAELLFSKDFFRKNGYDAVCLSLNCGDAEPESKAYQALLETAVQKIEAFEEKDAFDRQRQLVSVCQSELNELSEVKTYVLTNCRSTLEKTEIRLNDGREALDQGNAELKKAKEVLDNTENLIAVGKKALEEKECLIAKAEDALIKGKTEFEKYRLQLQEQLAGYGITGKDMPTSLAEITKKYQRLNDMISKFEDFKGTSDRMQSNVQALLIETDALATYLQELASSESPQSQLITEILNSLERAAGLACSVASDVESIVGTNWDGCDEWMQDIKEYLPEADAFLEIFDQFRTFQRLCLELKDIVQNILYSKEDICRILEFAEQCAAFKKTGVNCCDMICAFISGVPEIIDQLKVFRDESKQLLDILTKAVESEEQLYQREQELEHGKLLWQEMNRLYHQKKAQWDQGQEEYNLGESEYLKGIQYYNAAKDEYEQASRQYQEIEQNYDKEMEARRKAAVEIEKGEWQSSFPLLSAPSIEAYCESTEKSEQQLWNDAFEQIRTGKNYTVTRSYTTADGKSHGAIYAFSGDTIYIQGDDNLARFDFSTYITDAFPLMGNIPIFNGLNLCDDNIDHHECYFVRTSEGGKLYLKLLDPDLWFIADIQKDISGYLAFDFLDRIRLYENSLNQGTLHYDGDKKMYEGDKIDICYAAGDEEKSIISLSIALKNRRFDAFLEKGESHTGKSYSEEIRIEKYGETYFRLPLNVLHKNIFAGDV